MDKSSQSVVIDIYQYTSGTTKYGHAGIILGTIGKSIVPEECQHNRGPMVCSFRDLKVSFFVVIFFQMWHNRFASNQGISSCPPLFFEWAKSENW